VAKVTDPNGVQWSVNRSCYSAPAVLRVLGHNAGNDNILGFCSFSLCCSRCSS
jgi:hypothetical protein